MATVNEILEKARSYLGTKENPANSNNVIFNTHYYGKAVNGASYPWCATFIWDIFHMCNASHLFYGGQKSAYTPTIAQYYKDNKQWYTSPATGDLVFYQWASSARICHIGIVESVNPDGTITAIEGNTAIGNDSNGGEVMRRTRPVTYVKGYGRPAYHKSASVSTPEKTPSVYQKGVDVSSYQGKIDWKKVAGEGFTFAILRGVLKNDTLDNTFFYNYEKAKENGFDLACYQFSYALSEAEAIAAAQNMIAKLRGIQMPIWLDLEWATQGALGKSAVTNIAAAYVKACRAAGYDCHIYSNLDWYKNKYNANALRALGCQFWIARYAADGSFKEALRPGIGETIWQWTSQGTVNGITGHVDLNLKTTSLLGKIKNCSALNVRSQPDTSKQNIISVLRANDRILLLAEEKGWYYGKLSNGITGWVSAKYIAVI